MPTIDTGLRTLRRTCKPAAAILAGVTLASLALTACGGSSGSTTSHANVAATSTTTPTASTTASSRPAGAQPTSGASHFQAIRECLQRSGIAMPKRSATPGDPSAASHGFGGVGGRELPKGVTRTQFDAAMKKCGGANFRGKDLGRPTGTGPAPGAASRPGFRQGLAKFAACLRQNGIDVPAPNTNGKGPIFSTKGIDTKSKQFRAATMKCRGALIGAFRRQPGSKGAAGP